MKVMITGGGGFIGGWLGQKLAERGDDVTLVDVKHKIDEARWNAVKVKGMPTMGYAVLDVTDGKAVKASLQQNKPEYVVHLAAVSNTRECLSCPLVAWNVNMMGTANVLGYCDTLGIRSLFASTSLLSSCMGGDAEDAPMYVSDDVYCSTKQAGEGIAKRTGAVVARFGICYGPKMTPGVLFEIFVTRAMTGQTLYLDGGGLVQRQYLFVEDLANGVVKAMDTIKPGQVCHIVPETWTTPKDVADVLVKLLPNVNTEEREGRPAEIVCKYLLKNTKLDWKPELDLQQGLMRTVAWYSEQTKQK